MSVRNVLYVSPNAHLGGAEKACELFLRYHDRARYRPSIAFLRDGPLVEQFGRLNARVFMLPPVRLRQFARHYSLIGKLADLIRHNDIQLVHSTMAYGHFFGGRAANRARVRNVWFQHGPVAPRLDRVASLIRTDCVLVNSKYTEQEQRKIMWRRFPYEIVYAGIDEPGSATDARALGTAFRKRFGIPPDALVCGSVGRIQEWKGQLEFLKAFHVASRADERLYAVICGSADIGNHDYERELKAYVESNGLSGRVVLTGFFDELEAAYRAFDILVHSSVIAEPFGLVPLEGMIRGLAVIACPWGGPSETVQDGKTGLLVNPLDTVALSNALLRLAKDERLRAALGSAGTEAAAAFLGARFVGRVERVYDRILS